MTNLATGTKFQGIDNWGGRARLKFAPTETLTIDLTAELSRDGDKAAFSGFNRGRGPARSLAGADTPATPNSVFLGRRRRVQIASQFGRASCRERVWCDV